MTGRQFLLNKSFYNKNFEADLLSRMYSNKRVDTQLLNNLRKNYIWDVVPLQYFSLDLQFWFAGSNPQSQPLLEFKSLQRYDKKIYASVHELHPQ